MDGITFFDAAVWTGFALVIASIALTFVRLVRGPSLPDRVVALDMLTVLIVSFCGLEVLATGDLAFLDVALVVAVIGFLATVALARFAERREFRRTHGGREPGGDPAGALESGADGEAAR